jgi:hypothetical protein
MRSRTLPALDNGSGSVRVSSAIGTGGVTVVLTSLARRHTGTIGMVVLGGPDVEGIMAPAADAGESEKTS